MILSSVCDLASLHGSTACRVTGQAWKEKAALNGVCSQTFRGERGRKKCLNYRQHMVAERWKDDIAATSTSTNGRPVLEIRGKILFPNKCLCKTTVKGTEPKVK